jgi:hypothetical protein
VGVISSWGGFSGATVRADELMDVIFDPAGNYTTDFSVLNGELDGGNWSLGFESIPTWAIQPASFVVGMYYAWERWEFTYARQSGSDIGGHVFAIHAGLSHRVFLPWAARIVLYGYNVFARQDATVWDADASSGGPDREAWSFTTSIDDVEKSEVRVKVPHGRESDDEADDGSATTQPDVHCEDRWRYCTPMGAMMQASSSSNTAIWAKGYHTVKVRATGTIYEDDPKKAKILTPTGGLWLLAIR